MPTSVSKVDTFLSLRDGFERYAVKTDELVRSLEIELRRILESWAEREQEARRHERECQSDVGNAERDLRWSERRGDRDNPPDSSYEKTRLEKARRDLAQAQSRLQFVSRSTREVHMACEAFQKHGRALRQMATQTAPSAASHMSILLRDLERTSFVAPAKGNSQASGGGISGGAPPSETHRKERTVDSPTETVSAANQLQYSSSLRELATLLRGGRTFFSSPDTDHIALAVQKIRSIAEFTPATWQNLGQAQRIASAFHLESALAEVQGRPPVPVVIEGDDQSVYGGYDVQANRIALSRSFVVRSSSHEMIEAVIHTGRHAYQVYALRHPAFHSDCEEVGRWRLNHLYYLRAEIWGDEAYRNQPVERDAFLYTEVIIGKLREDTS